MSLEILVRNYMDLLRSQEKTMRIGEIMKNLNNFDEKKEIKINMSWVSLYKDEMLKPLKKSDDIDYWNERSKEYDNEQWYFTGEYGSDRGDYAKLGLGYSNEPNTFTVKDLKYLFYKALDEGEMTGYKGGEFDIDNNTLVTFANYRGYTNVHFKKFTEKENHIELICEYIN